MKLLPQQGSRLSRAGSAPRTVARAATLSVASPRLRTQKGGNKGNQFWERQILDALTTVKGRGAAGLSEEQLSLITEAAEALEASRGVDSPTLDPELNGKWRLLFTTRPGSASPIQRAFTGVDSFSVFQEVVLDCDGSVPRVNNVVEFGEVGTLRVEAEASTDSQPLPGFTPRVGEEFLFGLFGRSFIFPPARPNMRVDFQFDKAAFYFRFLPFSIPYPVPFKLLGDERKGWIDVTYLSEDRRFRLTRGNKGTLFILVKDIPLKQQLLEAIERKQEPEIDMLVEELCSANPTPSPATSSLATGTWRLIHSKQAETASALQKFGSSRASSFQIIDGEAGTVRNRVDLHPMLRISVRGECEPGTSGQNGREADRTNVRLSESGFLVGEGVWEKPWFIELPSPGNKADPKSGGGYVDWLYLDDDLRITRGNKGSLFVHTRVSSDGSDATPATHRR